jgi:hypothetical protein
MSPRSVTVEVAASLGDGRAMDTYDPFAESRQAPADAPWRYCSFAVR